MGFIGENGAGKTTTIKLILNIIKRDSGEIKIFGLDNIRDEKEIKQDIGVVFDELHFHETMNALDVNAVLKNIYNKWDVQKFKGYLDKFSIPERMPIKDYSRGMKMKLSISAALSHDAKLLILDEATSGLDPVVRDEILDIFFDFIQDEDHSIFISSHIVSDLEKICDYITFIHKGRIVLSQSKDELLEKYAILKCTAEQFENLDKEAVVGSRTNQFGVEALVYSEFMNGREYTTDRATIEDIMLFYVKEGDRK